jgi:hypothetical protein
MGSERKGIFLATGFKVELSVLFFRPVMFREAKHCKHPNSRGLVGAS